MGFDDAYIKKNIMLLKNIYRKVHVGIYELTKVNTAFQVCTSFCFEQRDKLLNIYMCHTLLEIYLAFVWYQMIRYTHMYLVHTGDLIPDTQVI